GQNAEYKLGGIGADSDSDGKPEYDCTGLITMAMRGLGYELPLRLTTGGILSNSSGLFVNVPSSQIRTGDIIVLKNDQGGWHAAVVEDYDPVTGNGHFYGANSSGVGSQQFGKGTYWNRGFQAFGLGPIPDGGSSSGFPYIPGIGFVTPLIYDLFTKARGAASPPLDPLILDLDGDGIETVASTNGAYFDHDGNGFAERTGWTSAHDGLLVMDRNGDGIINNGGELFGDQTILHNGRMATDSFQALSDLDDNGDGRIDTNDTAFSQLKIWQDRDGDGYSSADELKTLAEMGINALNTTHGITNTPDGHGNTQIQAGTYIKTDGTTGQMGGVVLQRDTAYTMAEGWLDIPADIAALPDLQGYGNVYDLQPAMVRDGSGQLKGLVESFMAATDV
ncbi:MAG: C40 family peptidase, partial [Syntrophales bacterium LBB04]|nr:C40 family peptidase [Syntrophales bacterium LBB04]